MTERFRILGPPNETRSTLRQSRLTYVDHRKTLLARNERESTPNKSSCSSKLRSHSQINRTRTQSFGGTQLDMSNDQRKPGLSRSASVTHLRTPGKRSPARNTTAISNEQNRKACAENIQKVLNILQRDENNFNRLNLTGGLKSMSAKQFVDILGYFVYIISGRRIIAKSKNDYEAEILAVIRSINYPNTVNKSWLKTPSAPHAFHECVALLAWLSDFIHYRNRGNENCGDMLVAQDFHFPDVKYTQIFSDEVRKGFHLWNKQADEEFEKLERVLIDRYLSAWMNDRIKTSAELERNTEQLKIANKELEQFQYTIKNEKQFEAIQLQHQSSEKQLKKLEMSILEKSDLLASIKIVHDEQRNFLALKEATIRQLMHTIEHQKYTITELYAVNMKLTTTKHSNETIKNEIMAIQNDAVASQVHLARQLQQKSDAVANFNKLSFKISQTILKNQSHRRMLNELHLEPTASSELINATCEKLYRLHADNECAMQRSQHHIERFKVKKIDLVKKLKLLTEKILKENLKLTNINKKLTGIDDLIAKRNVECRNRIDKLLRAIDTEGKRGQQLRTENEAKIHQLERLKHENELYMKNGETRAYELIQMKLCLVQHLDEVNKFIDKMSGGLYENEK